MGQHRTVYATFWIRSHACATTRPQISTYRNRQDRNYRFRECFLITSTNLARAGNFFIGCWGSHNRPHSCDHDQTRSGWRGKTSG
jgi:hypothetical protein